jgi:hypothetical protein
MSRGVLKQRKSSLFVLTFNTVVARSVLCDDIVPMLFREAISSQVGVVGTPSRCSSEISSPNGDSFALASHGNVSTCQRVNFLASIRYSFLKVEPLPKMALLQAYLIMKDFSRRTVLPLKGIRSSFFYLKTNAPLST